MDEVDFTILAATSVLGDLIEKCPPAEACRDAFERMSKATVQMCMSTTGFSSNALNANNHRKNERRTSGDYFGSTASTPYAGSTRSHKSSGHHHHHHRPNSAERQQQRSQSRPAPQFDMALNDLYPQATQAQQTRVQPPQAQPQAQYQQNPGYGNNNSGILNNADNSSRMVKNEYSPRDAYVMPPSRSQNSSPHASNYSQPSPDRAQLQNNPIDPSLLPSPQQSMQTSPQQSMQSYLPPNQSMNNNMYNGSNGPNNNINNNGGNNTPFENIDFSNMDFLGVGGPASMGPGGFDGQGQVVQPTGMDFGFGLGWDGTEHDFSEGNQYDLFDGFFFGGGGAGMGGG